MFKKTLFLFGLLFSFALLGGCHHFGKRGCDKKESCSKKDRKSCCGKKSWFKKDKKCCGMEHVVGKADVQSVTGQKIKGEVIFEKEGRHEFKVTAQFSGLKANQQFGFHIHEFGNCGNKALMAGGHLNPSGESHGGPEDEERHLGDLGNLSSDNKGYASYSAVVKGKLKKVFGRSVIVHAQADDLKSQPTGNAGERMACGVIVVAMPPVEEKATTETTDSKPEKSSHDTHHSSTEKPSTQLKKAVDIKPELNAEPEVQQAVDAKKQADKKPEVQQAVDR